MELRSYEFVRDKELGNRFLYLSILLNILLNSPNALKKRSEKSSLIRPNNPVLVVKDEGRVKTTFMSWGLIYPWSI